MSDPKPIAPYKLAQRLTEQRLQRRRYLTVDGAPAPDGPYVLYRHWQGTSIAKKPDNLRRDRK